MRFAKIFVCLLTATLLPGCGKFSAIEGSGVIVSEKRTVADYSGIEVGGAVVLDVTVGDKTSLEITTDDNLLPHLTTESKDGTLTIRFEGSYSTKHGIRVKAVTPKLTSLQGSGATTSSVAGIKENFSVHLSGASKATLMGKLDELTAQCSGASRLKARDLEAATVKADASGASAIEVKATKELSGTASGASTILYAAGLEKLTVNATGVSTVKQAD